MTCAQLMSGASDSSRKPNSSSATRAMNSVQDLLSASQNFRPDESARKCASSSGERKADWWWSNHHVRRSEGLYLKSTMAFSSPSNIPSSKSAPAVWSSGA